MATLSGLPPELLRRIFVALFAAEAEVAPNAVPPTPSIYDEDVQLSPLVTRRVWAAAAGAAGACIATRAAFLDAVEAVEVDLSDQPLEPNGVGIWDGSLHDPRACIRRHLCVRRGAEFAVTLGRLHALRRLTLRFDSIRSAEVVHTVGGLLLGLLAQKGAPALHELTVHGGRVSLLSYASGLPRGQPSLRHVLFKGIPTERLQPRPDGDRFVALCWGMADRLASLDLQAVDYSLHTDNEVAFVELFERRLPVLPTVRFVNTGVSSPMSQRMLAAVARCCPATATLCCTRALDASVNCADGGRVLVGLFPFLRRLCLTNAAPSSQFRGFVSSSFVAAVSAHGALAGLWVNGVVGAPGDTSGLLAAATPHPPADLVYLQPVRSFGSELAASIAPGLRRLQLNSVLLSEPICRALSRLSDLRALFLRSGFALKFCLNAASVLAPPALTHLYLNDVTLEGAAATGLVTALSLSRPQTLRGLYLADCAGDVEGALVAATHLRSLTRVVVARHLLPNGNVGENGRDEDGWYRGSAFSRYPLVADCLDARRPDLVYTDHF